MMVAAAAGACAVQLGTPSPEACDAKYVQGAAGMVNGRKTLRALWCEYSEAPVLDRYVETADQYDMHMPAPGSAPQIKMLEMGVQSGGSTRSWKQHYGAGLYYVGFDLNPGSVRSSKPEENIFVETGSQTNASYLLDLCARHGPFDVVIDDGGHTTSTIRTSMASLFPSDACMKEHSLYVIEDMHTMHYSGHVKAPSALYGIVGEAFWSMHHMYVQKPNRYGAGQRRHAWFKDVLHGVHGYTTIAFFVRGPPKTKVLSHLIRGTDKLPDVWRGS